MKKVYNKPVLSFENFQLDVNFAGACSNNDMYAEQRFEYESGPDSAMLQAMYGSLAEYLASFDYGNTDGDCYFTVSSPTVYS